MTAPAQADLLRRVGIALDCYASTLHAQAWAQSNPGIKEAKEQERADIEALREEVRLLAQQPAPASDLAEENRRLREALAWFADEKAWYGLPDYESGWFSPATLEGRGRARAALSAAEAPAGRDG